MLGWTVPRECPIQNEVSGNQFIQKVDRVDLGSLDWIYDAGKNNVYGFAASIPNAVLVENTDTQIRCFANGLNGVSASNIITLTSQNLVGLIRNNKVYVTSSYASEQLANFIASMQDKYLYYELATPITMTIDENELTERINKSLSVIGKCKNLLKPVFVSGWGCNCVIGDDGKITLTSTNTEDYQVVIGYIHKCSLKANKTYYFRAFDIINIDHIVIGKVGSDDLLKSFYNQLIYTPTEDMDIQLLIYFSDKTVGTISSCYISVSEVYTDEYVPYTGDGKTLTHDVAKLKNDLSTKIYELAGSELYLCVSGKNCVLTLNGYNLTGSTNFSKLAEYPPYLVARNVVSKEDGVCIFSVDPNGNVSASDLQVASSVTGKMFGEVSWVANI